MSEPEWVDPDAPTPEPEHVSERDLLINLASAQLQAIKVTIDQLRGTLLRLDEIGEPVSRSRTRATKLDEAHTDVLAHFDYDVIKKLGKPTKDQKTRAERHELS